MADRHHIQKQSSQKSAFAPRTNPFEPRPFANGVRARSAELPKTDLLQTRPFAPPIQPEQEIPDLQTQGEIAEPVGHSLDKIRIHAPSAPPPPPSVQRKGELGGWHLQPIQRAAPVINWLSLSREEKLGQQKVSAENSTLQKQKITDKELQDDSYHRIASDITGVFEGGKPGSLQIKDSGIISYGKHQATLASGSLYSILKAYTDISKTSTALKIAEYLERVQKKDVTLRDDKAFIQLLKEAANEPEMASAQEEVFSKNYWNPAKQKAEKAGIQSALGKAIFYDTQIHSFVGLKTTLENTQQRLKDKKYTEQEFLSVFLEERQKFLYQIAQKKRTKAEKELSKGNEKEAKTLKTTAEMLEKSAQSRIGALQALVNSGDLNLIGDENGQIKVKGTKISGLGKGATYSNDTKFTPKSGSQDNSQQETTSQKTQGVKQSTTSSQSTKTTHFPDNSHQEKKSESKAETSQVGFKPSDPKGHITKLHPNLQTKVKALIENAHKRGLDVRIIQGMRTIEEQNDLYAQGRTKGKKGKIVTKAKGGDSYHNYGLAVDVVFNGSQPYGENHNWTELGAAGQEAGLEWGGNWKSFKDRPHFQIPGLKISQIKSWYVSGGMENVWKNVSAK